MNVVRTASCIAIVVALAAASFSVNAQDATCGKNHYILDFAAKTWVAAGDLNVPRSMHTATLLPDGKVLVAGGRIPWQPDVTLESAELYDPTAGSWVVTGSLTEPRSGHTATLLPDGKVLVAGGESGTASAGTAELYDPSTGRWTATGSLNTPRSAFTATLLANGRVLIVGGVDHADEALASTELYDPSTEMWSPAADLITKRFSHTATLLDDGRVLVAGGLIHDFYQWMTSEAELYDPVAGTWSSTARLYWFRAFHTATRLQDGKVLVAGGYRYELMDPASLAEAVLFDPVSATWTTVANLNVAREGHTATLLPNGKVLVAGGFDWGIGPEANGTELYEAASSTWSDAGSLSLGRIGHTATLLPGGTVLVVGGESGGWNNSVTLRRAELYLGLASDDCQ